MTKHSKRYETLVKERDADQIFSLADALKEIKQRANAKFDETVEMAVNLGVDPKHADQQVRGTVGLPHGTGRKVRVLVFAKDDKAKEAEEAGADFVGGEELAEKIQKENWLDFDVVIATPDMMRFVGKLGRVLGPRGLMPNPKTGTVTMEVGQAVKEFKAGKIEYRVDRSGVIHAPIGKASFSEDALEENAKTLVLALQRARPSVAKGTYLKSMYLTTTMGPSFKLDTAEVKGY
jgi:large subunit ribosomal protein L1